MIVFLSLISIVATTEAKTPRSKKKATPKGGAVNNSITAVLFQNDNTLLSAGDCDGYCHLHFAG